MKKEDEIIIESEPAEKNRIWKILITLLIILLLLAIILVISFNVYDSIAANKNQTSIIQTNTTQNTSVASVMNTTIINLTNTARNTTPPDDNPSYDAPSYYATPQHCTPNCAGKQCGSDGCLATCGTCGAGFVCNLGKCDYSKSGVPVSCYGGNLNLAWNDEFEGDTINRSNWEVLWESSPTGEYARRGGYWVGNFSSVENGSLVIKTDLYKDKWGSGAVRTFGKFEARYGYYEGRFKFPVNSSGEVPKQIAAHWPAFWLMAGTVHCNGAEVDTATWTIYDLTYGNVNQSTRCAKAWSNIRNEYGLDLPNADAPEKGLLGGIDGVEVDIFEYWTHNELSHNSITDGYSSAYAKKSGLYFPVWDTDHPNREFFSNLNLSDKQFHTVGMCWTPDEYIFYIDGVESHRISGNKCSDTYLFDNSCASDTWNSSMGQWFTTDFQRYMPGGVSRVPEYIKITDEVGDNGIFYGGDMRNITDLPHFFYTDYIRFYNETGGA